MGKLSLCDSVLGSPFGVLRYRHPTSQSTFCFTTAPASESGGAGVTLPTKVHSAIEALHASA